MFSDILNVTGENAKVLAAYETDFYKGRAALAENRFGKGRVLHFGGTFTRENVREFLEYTGTLSPYRKVIELPESCELAVREKDGTAYCFVLNYSAKETAAVLKQPMTDMDTEETVSGRICLAPYETKVYKLK